MHCLSPGRTTLTNLFSSESHYSCSLCCAFLILKVVYEQVHNFYNKHKHKQHQYTNNNQTAIEMKLQTLEGRCVLTELVAAGDFDKVRQLLRSVPLPHDLVLGVILQYTPPLTPSEELLFLDEWLKLPQLFSSEVAASFTEDEIVLGSMELSSDSLHRRLGSPAEVHPPTLFQFIHQRTRKLDIVDFEDPLFHSVANVQQFQQWKSTTLAPFQYLRSINSEHISLTTFEGLNEQQRVHVILKAMQYAGIQQLLPPFIIYLRSLDRDILLQLLQDVDVEDDICLLNQIIKLLFSEVHTKDRAIQLVLKLFYSYESPNVQLLESMCSTLDVIKMSYSNEELSRASAIIRATLDFPLQYRTLQNLLDISRDPVLQLERFETIINSSSRNTIKLLLQHFKSLRRGILPDLDDSKTKRLLLNKLLSLKLYDDVQVDPSDESVILEHFWDCFKTATNGSKDRGELMNAYQSLSIIQPRTAKVESLIEFIDAVDQLFQYSIYFKRGSPFKPVDLLTIDMDSLLQKILELNDDAYKSHRVLYTLFAELSKGLPTTTVIPSSETVQCLCIDSSLVHDDFKFAMALTTQLMASTSPQFQTEKWYTWFQVGKYISPDWLDTEVAEEVVKQQMTLLSNILMICPIEHSQAVISQWKSLEMELSMRDELIASEQADHVHLTDSKSLDQRFARALSSTANELLRQGDGTPISNLLTNGLGWAIGSRNHT